MHIYIHTQIYMYIIISQKGIYSFTNQTEAGPNTEISNSFIPGNTFSPPYISDVLIFIFSPSQDDFSRLSVSGYYYLYGNNVINYHLHVIICMHYLINSQNNYSKSVICPILQMSKQMISDHSLAPNQKTSNVRVSSAWFQSGLFPLCSWSCCYSHTFVIKQTHNSRYKCYSNSGYATGGKLRRDCTTALLSQEIP